MRFYYTNNICLFLLICGLYCSEGCLDKERRLLLQIKDSVRGYAKNIFPLGSWVGENCCEWPAVECKTSSNSSSHHDHGHVVSIDLTQWDYWSLEVSLEVETWYPNGSLFAEFEHLESVSLSFIGGWRVKPQGLCGMKNLKNLTIYDSNLYDEGTWCLLTNSSKLEKLDLIDTNIRNLDGLCEMRNLKILYLSGTDINDELIPSCWMTNSSNKLEELYLFRSGLRSLEGLRHLSKLRVLDLTYSHSLNESMNSLQGLCEMRNLKILRLYGTDINDELIPSCWMTNSSNKLEELVLDGSGLRSLEGLCEMQNLKILDLSGNDIDDELIPSCWMTNSSNKLEELYLIGSGLRSLEGLRHLSNLRALYLRSNSLNKSMNSLQGLTHLSNLRALYLIDISFNESINSLQGLCEMQNLKILGLSRNGIHDEHIPSCWMTNSSNKLEEIYLSGNHLRSLDGFAQMRSLKKLTLSDNSLNASIDSLSGLQKLSNLEDLDLSHNQLTDRNIGLWISNLTSLVRLDLFDNHLKNPKILKGLCSLRNLHDLYLFANAIEGQIPTCFKDMHFLQRLYLSDNLLSGGIPHFIFSNLTMMETIDVGDNHLSGVIPFFMFANLSKLSYIDLSNNPEAKVETEYPHWIPTFQLSKLNLKRCNVSSNIPSFLSSQHNLGYLELDHSFINGPIPPWILYNVSSPMVLSLRGNLLEGPFPKSSQLISSMLVKIDISDNYIYGTLPMNIGVLFPMLFHFNASKNALQGNIPPSLGDLSMLKTLDLSINNLSGEISSSLVKNKTSSLRYLDLSNNHFEGQIFAGDFINASQLRILFLHNNHFNESLPQSLSNSYFLMFLNIRNNIIAGPIPSWLSSLPNLVSILFGGNHFTGHIPWDFCRMQSLHTLDLSNNSLSGSIPSCLNNVFSLVKNSSMSELLDRVIDDHIPLSDRGITYLVKGEDIGLRMDFATKGMVYTYEGIPLSLMTGLDFSMNRLTGHIPPQFGDLKELRTLNLSHNHLTGLIPESFKYLTNIESLDLSHNKLSGSIPFQLVQLYSLSSFYITFNNLSGKIPSGGQFNTFNVSSYAGNIGLCGPPIEQSCLSTNQQQSSYKKKGNDEPVLDIINKPVIFYLWVLFSYAFGFSSFALVLICNANWRWKYFKIVDECIDSTVNRIRKFWY